MKRPREQQAIRGRLGRLAPSKAAIAIGWVKKAGIPALGLLGELAGRAFDAFRAGNQGPHGRRVDGFAQEVDAAVGEDGVAAAGMERERFVVQTAVVGLPGAGLEAIDRGGRPAHRHGVVVDEVSEGNGAVIVRGGLGGPEMPLPHAS